MLTGILCGFIAAICNAAGYLFSARFMRHYHSPVRLLIIVEVTLLVMSLPFLCIFFPWNLLPCLKDFFIWLGVWLLAFSIGQTCFFMALHYVEASRLSSMLGLKIIVLTGIVIFVNHTFPNAGQWIAILMAASAGVMINRARGNLNLLGCFFIFMVLILYSLTDISASKMAWALQQHGFSTFKSAFLLTLAAHSSLGFLSLFGFFAVRMTKRQFVTGMPYAVLWFVSQIAIYTCFALIKPVFGNVILSSRGLFSVLFGALLAYFGYKKWDADIPRKQWILRAVAASLMVAAIALYSFASMQGK